MGASSILNNHCNAYANVCYEASLPRYLLAEDVDVLDLERLQSVIGLPMQQK